MSTINKIINENQKIHFIGIGGISMSAIANVLLSQGFKVTGSDFKESAMLDDLRANGAEIFVGHRASNISDDTALVVYTAAIHPDNPELKEAASKGIKTLTRADFLGMLMKDFGQAICVSGTHGKTTTTSLLSQILIDGKTDPTIIVGGIVPFLNGNLKIGKNDYFLTEACEYTNSFLSFFPTISIILNVQADHMDFFKDLDDIRNSFRQFAALTDEKGCCIINGEIENLDYIIKDAKAKIITFGIDGDYTFTAKNIDYDEDVHPSFDVYKEGSLLGSVSLKIRGTHNVSNALSAIACADALGIPFETTKEACAKFEGVERRFDVLGKLGGATVVDDYAHHPDEIKATLKTALDFPHKKLYVVFQPHTYSRTKAFLDEFAESLSLADCVVLTDIYAAREKNDGSVSSDDIRQRIERLGTECYYLPSFGEAEDFLLENLLPDDLLITMGAGDVVNIGKNLLGK